MRPLILAAALLVAGAAHAQYNDPSQASPQTSPPIDQTAPPASDVTQPSGEPAADTGAPTPGSSDAAPTTAQMGDTVALPKCSRKVTDRCVQRR